MWPWSKYPTFLSGGAYILGKEISKAKFRCNCASDSPDFASFPRIVKV